MSEEKKNPKIIHTKKLFGGQKTTEEVYAELAVGKPCGACSRPGITKLGTLVALDDLKKRRPDFLAVLMASCEPGAQPPIIKTIYGPMVCVSEMIACKSCTPAAEKAASQGEREWSRMGITVHVEIRRPPPDNPMFQVPESATNLS